MLNEGKGDNIQEEEGKEHGEDKEGGEEESAKRKGKSITKKTPKTSTPIFTSNKPRKSRRKTKLHDDDDEEEEDTIIFKKPPLTFEKKLKYLKKGSGMEIFRFLKYASRRKEENEMI